MLTAHFPAGYILGRALSGRRSRTELLYPAILGAVVPDIDLLFFHLVDQGSFHHHLYPAHWPLFWAGLCLPLMISASLAGWTRLRDATLAFFLGILLHLGLDSIASPVYWLMPLAEGRVELVEVPARYRHWIFSFLLHWTFLLEIAIWLLAGWLFFRPRPRRRIFVTQH